MLSVLKEAPEPSVKRMRVADPTRDKLDTLLTQLAAMGERMPGVQGRSRGVMPRMWRQLPGKR